MNMFKRSVAVTALSDAPPPAAVIADGVRRVGTHHVAEKRLSDLRAQRDKHNAELQVIIDTPDVKMSEGQKRPVLNEIQAKIAEVEEDIREARLDLVPLRAAHAERISEALAEHRAASANRIAQGLVELQAGVAAFNEVQDALRKASADAPSIRLPDLEAITRVARGR